MPNVTPQQANLIGIIVAPAIFALCAFFTRASFRRSAGGLAGVAAYCAVQFAWDRIAAVTGWWSYPAYGMGGSMPASIYLLSGLVFAGFGLLGWRITRRFGWRGMLAFLAAWSLWGFVLDNLGSVLFSNSRLMVIGPGVAAKIADFLVYATCMGGVMLAIRVIGWPFRADALARTRKSSTNQRSRMH